MLKMFKYLKIKEWLLALAGLVFILAQVWLDLRVPEYMSEITLLVQTPGSAMRDIWIAGGYMLLCTAGSLTAFSERNPPLFHRQPDYPIYE